MASDALAYAQKNKKAIARRLTDPNRFPPDENPVSVFMAGSPGAGKTEASIELLEELDNTPTIRIDIDDVQLSVLLRKISVARCARAGKS